MEITNVLGLPQPFVEAAKSEYEYTDGRYSITALNKSLREATLLRRHHDEIVVDVADLLWSIFGKAVHSIIESAPHEECELSEHKLEQEVAGGVISGRCDLFNTQLECVTDYKTASVYKVIGGDFSDQRKQLLGYAWLLTQQGFSVKSGENIFMLKDHSAAKVKSDETYPPHPVHRETYEFTRGEIAKEGQWLTDRVATLEGLRDTSDAELPLCTEEERWTTETKYAVCKEGLQRSKKNCATFEEAESVMAEFVAKDKKGKYFIEPRPGIDRKCINYCSCCEFCDYWQENYSEKEEV